MTINKLIKYTSLLFLGLWIVATPSNSFAANEKVENEIVDFSKAKLSDGTALTKGKQMKADVAKYAEDREKIRKKYEEAKKQFDDKHGEGRSKCFAAYKERMKNLFKDQNDEFKNALNKAIEDLFNDDGIFTKGWNIIANSWNIIWKNPINKGVWETAKSALSMAYDELQNHLNTKENSTSQLSAVSQVTFMQEKCNTNGVNDKFFEAYMKIAVDVDHWGDQLAAMPATIDEDATLMVYQVSAGLDENGNPIYQNHYFLMSKDGTLKSIGGVTDKCVPLPAKLAESRSCIFCPLFKTLFTAVQNMSTKSYNALAQPLANVVLVAFSLVVAFMVLKNVSSFTKQDAPKFITELLVNIFKVLVAFYMLKNSNIVYNYIIGPILKAGFEFGSSLLFEKGNSYLASCKTPDLTNSAMIGVIPTYLYSNLDCFIKAVQAEVSVPQSIGSTLMCVARNAGKENVGPVRNLLWDFSMMFQGLAIWVMGWIMSLAFAFYLIDATIQLGIVGALMPFLIACWPFKATKTYTSKGWSMFMNTFFVYVFMGLVVSINVQLLGQSLTGGNGGFDEIMRAINGNEVTKLKDLLDIGFSGFLVFIACCLFAFKLTGQASSLAGSMGHGGGPQIGSNIGGLAANTATKGVQGTAKFGIKTAKTVSDKTGLTSKINQGKDWLANKALGMVGLGRRSGKAGNAQARRSQMTAAAAGGAAAAAAGTPPVPPSPSGSGSSDAATPTAQSQIKKMQQTGPRSTQPATPKPQTPPSGGNNGNNAGNGGNSDNTNNSGGKGGAAKPATLQNQPSQPQNQEQLRQQLENDYNNTANGKAGQQMIQNQTAEVARNQKAENEAQGKMNYHNRRADDYLQKAQKSTDPAQKKNFEDLANAQFNEAVKAEAAYNKAKADTQRAQAELNAIKQENERYKNEFVQTEMNKRQPTQK